MGGKKKTIPTLCDEVIVLLGVFCISKKGLKKREENDVFFFVGLFRVRKWFPCLKGKI